MKNTAWSSAQTATAEGIFKLQSDSAVQNAGALGSLERKRKKTRMLPLEDQLPRIPQGLLHKTDI